MLQPTRHGKNPVFVEELANLQFLGARIFYPAINVLRELKWRDIFVAFFLIAFKGYRPIPFLLSHRQNLFGRIRVESDVFEKENVGVTPERGLVWRRRQSVLQRFRATLQDRLPSSPNETALGRDAYVFFLKNVALYPYSPEQILAMGQQEWNRAVAFESYEKERNKNFPPLRLAKNVDSWIKDAGAKELQIREFLDKHGILTVPSWLQHYTLRPMPEYLRVLGFSENDDFTSPSRLNENCIRYVSEPSGNLGYFWRATAQDPRPIIVHEGIPGHYFQLCLSWKHEDPIRRHYYDSGANEGIGFYAEEMMLQNGLFDDSPHTREIIYNFMRLRALRVEVDVKLALGQFSLEEAAKYLEQKVPMDTQTARQEAIAFSTGPGQALTYQIGKLQIMQLLAEAGLQQGDKFNLRAFHDFVWKNGNVPIALQRWEYLGAS